MRYSLGFLCLLFIVFLMSCEEESKANDNKGLLKEIEQLEEEVASLEQDKKTMEIEVNRLKKSKEELEKRHKLSLGAIQEWEKNFYNDYPLLKRNTVWDRIVITGAPEGEKVVIKSPNVLKEFSRDFKVIEEIQTGSGTRPDIPQYTYTLEKGDKSLSIQVVGRGIIRLGGKYYSTNRDIHMLGTAFYHAPSYVDLDSVPLVTKLAYSGYIEGEKVYNFGTFSGFRIIGTIQPLVENGDKLKDKPSDSGEVYENFHFYYYGEEITVKVFKEKYIHILTKDQSYWYEMKDPTNIGRILTAG